MQQETNVVSRPRRSCRWITAYVASFYFRSSMFYSCCVLLIGVPAAVVMTIWYINQLSVFSLLGQDAKYIINSLVLMGAGVCSIPVGLYGHYVTFNPNKHNVVKLIKVSAWTFALTYLLIAATLPTMEKSVTEAVEQMERYQKYYDTNITVPSLSWSSGITERATFFWDRVQEGLDCCGFHYSSDWIQYGSYSPKGPYIYPHTCCTRIRRDGYCFDTADFRSHGCSKELREKLLLVLMIGYLMIASSFGLAICAGIMYLLYPFEQQQQQQQGQQPTEAGDCYPNITDVIDLESQQQISAPVRPYESASRSGGNIYEPFVEDKSIKSV